MNEITHHLYIAYIQIMKDIGSIVKNTFANNPWIGHVLFWLVYWLAQSMLMSENKEIDFYLAKNLAMVSIQILLVYVNLYVLIPFLFLKNRGHFYVLICIVLIYICYTYSFRWFEIVLAWIHQLIPNVFPLKFPDVMHQFNYNFWQVFSGSVPYSLALVCSTAYHLLKSNQQKEQEKAWLALEKNTTELQFLKSQISPHFLFNSLNNLHYLIGKDQDLSKKYTLKLSEILRYIVYEAKEDTVPLKAEMNHINAYIDLIKLSIEQPDQITFIQTGNYDSSTIGPLILLSVIENGIKHSGIKYAKHAKINISIELTNQELFLEMKNTIDQHVEEASIKSDSLQNLKKRLDLLYPNKHSFDLNLEKNEAISTLHIQLK